MSRPANTRYLSTDDVEANDDRESRAFLEFTAEVGVSVKRLKVATLRSIKDDLAARKVELIERWLLDSLENLRAAEVIYFDVSHWQISKYVFGAELKRTLPKINHESRLFVKKPKNDFVNLGL